MRVDSNSDTRTSGAKTPVSPAELADELAATRRRTLALVEPLSEELLARQVRDFMSPLIWDLGHIASFEQLWLLDTLGGHRAGLDERFDALETPRRERGKLVLPGKPEACAWLEEVRAGVLAVLGEAELSPDDALLCDGYVYRMVMQHECQHQETMLQALDIPAAGWGYAAACGDALAGAGEGRGGESACDRVDDEARISIPAGSFTMGTQDRGRAYDNERPRHTVDVDGFAIERYPVSNRRWLEFIADGGYGHPELWSAAGRDWLSESEARHPQAWEHDEDGWGMRRFGWLLPLNPAAAVQHVCFWEAEAFALWSGARLPTEQEWEKAAAWGPRAQTAQTYPWGEQRPRDARQSAIDAAAGPPGWGWGPPALEAAPQSASRYGVEDLFGSVYQWTCSEFHPYPGFEAFPYAEYSEVFFGDTYRVLRGASWATPELLWRNTYRNWDLPHRRQIFAGVRLVYDA